MADTLYIGHDITTSRCEVIFDENDFVRLVEEYMGTNARDYLVSIIDAREQAKEDAKHWDSEAEYYSLTAYDASRDAEYWRSKYELAVSEATASECGLVEIADRETQLHNDILDASQKIRYVLLELEKRVKG